MVRNKYQLQITKTIKDQLALLPVNFKTKPIIVAVSAGLDSSVLLHLLKASAAFPKIIAAHVCYGLRPAENRRELSLLKSTCKNLQIELLFHHAKLGKTTSNLQNQARQIRYDWFKQLSREFKTQLIATAHHEADLAETFLIRLVQGAQAWGLRGIDSLQTRSDKLILWRPLLTLGKSELLGYAQACGLKWCEDSSNQKALYLRNKIRLKVLPELQKLNPNVTKNIRHVAWQMGQVALLLREQATKLLKPALKNNKSVTLTIKKLVTLNPALRYELIEQAWQHVAGNPLGFDRVEQLDHAMTHPEKNRSFDFREDIKIVQDKIRLVICKI